MAYSKREEFGTKEQALATFMPRHSPILPGSRYSEFVETAGMYVWSDRGFATSCAKYGKSASEKEPKEAGLISGVRWSPVLLFVSIGKRLKNFTMTSQDYSRD